jgi:hypothetical protein
MRHPTEGVLRRLLDEPAAVADSDRRHVAGCLHCLDVLAAVRADAVLVGSALATGAAQAADGVDVTAAWRRLSTAAPAPEAARPGRPARQEQPRRRRSFEFMRRPAAAALAVGLVLTGAGTAAANDWLQIFRTEKLAPVTLTSADLLSLPDLSDYGTITASRDPDVHEVADAAAAKSESGLEVPQVSELPRGVGGEPVYQVGGTASATFTFSADRAAWAAAEAGESLPAVPPGLDGARVRLEAGPGVAAIWSEPAGVPALLVGRAAAPTASSSGVPFETLRDYLLSLPGLPVDVAAQLRSFTGDGSVLPLPVNADELTTSSADVNGVAATVLAARDRTMAAVVWVDNGVATAVVGALDADEVLTVARGLR